MTRVCGWVSDWYVRIGSRAGCHPGVRYPVLWYPSRRLIGDDIRPVSLSSTGVTPTPWWAAHIPELVRLWYPIWPERGDRRFHRWSRRYRPIPLACGWFDLLRVAPSLMPVASSVQTCLTAYEASFVSWRLRARGMIAARYALWLRVVDHLPFRARRVPAGGCLVVPSLCLSCLFSRGLYFILQLVSLRW